MTSKPIQPTPSSTAAEEHSPLYRSLQPTVEARVSGRSAKSRIGLDDVIEAPPVPHQNVPQPESLSPEKKSVNIYLHVEISVVTFAPLSTALVASFVWGVIDAVFY